MPQSIQQIETPSISLPKGGGAIKGIGETFEPNLLSGMGNYTIKIPVPTARGYMPQLAITYGSGNGNGLFGLGFALALPKISVRTDKGIPKYRGKDLYLSDFGKLVRKDKEPYQSGDYTVYEYLPLLEGSLALIRQLVKTDKSESYWEIVSASNETKIFGKTENTRIFDPEDPSRIFEWLIESSTDSKGNSIIYRYKAENDQNVPHEPWEENHSYNNKYIASITYGNYQDVSNSQRFAYELIFDYGEYDISNLEKGNKNPYIPVKEWDYRPDPFSSYLSGFEIRTCRLCKNILIFHHFEKELGDPLLTRALSFQYTYQDTYGNVDIKSSSLMKTVTLTGYQRHGKKSGDAYEVQQMPEVDFNFSAFNPPSSPEFKKLEVDTCTIPGYLNSGIYQSVDLNGEGIPGILYNDNTTILYFEPLGDGKYAAPKSLHDFPVDKDFSNGSVSLADLDGNGELQLVVKRPERKGFYEKTSEGWKNYQGFTRYPEGVSNQVEFIGMNHNGKTDLVLAEINDLLIYESLGKKGYDNPVRAQIQQGFPSVIAKDPKSYVGYANVMGDGLPHRIKITNGSVECWPDMGYGKFGKKISLGNAPWFDTGFDTSRLLLADIDGSGTVDIIYTYPDRIALFLNQSGNYFSDPVIIKLPDILTDVDSVFLADILGNGTSCLVFTKIDPVPVHYYYDFVGEIGLDGKTAKSIKPYLLNEINNNLGTVSQIQYCSSTKFYLEDKRNGTPWITKLPFPVQVVEKTIKIDRISGSRYTQTFKYHDGFYDHDSRAFWGFGYVESWDTEDYTDYVSNMKVNGMQPMEEKLFIPPVYTRTWQFTGAYAGHDEITQHYKNSYYQGDAQAYDFPGSVFEKAIYESDLDTIAQAYSSLRGLVIRTEVYALDNTPESNTPYTVSESNYEVKLYQPKGNRAYAVLMVNQHEQISYQYERNPDDPRIKQQFALKHDRYGNILQSCSVFLSRRNQAGITVYPEQQQLSGTVTVSTYVTPFSIDGANPLNWFNIPWQEQNLELNGLDLKDGQYFSFQEIKTQAETALQHIIPYGTDFGTGFEARTLTWSRSFFWDENPERSQDFLPAGRIDLHALTHHTEIAEFTPDFITRIYGNKLPDNVIYTNGGYFYDETNGYWWNKGQVQYYYGLDGLDKPNFYLPVSTENTFAVHSQQTSHKQDPSLCSKTTVQYDDYFLNLIQVTQWGEKDIKFTNQARIDYRVSSPYELTDPNNNTHQVLFDPVGQVVVTTVFGMENGAETGGMKLYPQEGEPAEYQWNGLPTFQQVINDPEKYLQGATSYFYYDFNTYKKSKQPACSVNLIRNNYYHSKTADATPYCQIQVTYNDGFGRVIEKKSKTTSGEALLKGQYEVVGCSGSNKEFMQQVDDRWIADARTVYNNKGKAFEKYLPYFINVPDYVPRYEITLLPPSVIHYDPLGRVIRTDTPKCFFAKVEFSAWEEKYYDEDDTVKDSEYYINFFENYPSSPTQQQKDEKDALEKAAKFYNTPHIKISDNKGYIFRDIQLKSSGEELISYYKTDIQGRNLSAIDPRLYASNLNDGTDYYNFKYAYTMNSTEGSENGEQAHKPIYINSIDAGTQTHFSNIFGSQLLSWSARNYCQWITYDRLQRKKSLNIKKLTSNETIFNPDDFNLVEFFTYGDNLIPDKRTKAQLWEQNLFGELYQLNDLSGIVKNTSYSLLGETLETSRQMVKSYTKPVKWNPGSEPDLETDIFESKSAYNGVKQLVEETTPDGSTITNTYNELGQLCSVSLQRSGKIQQVIDEIGYNANGQRTMIQYGNGIRTRNTYDEQSLMLTAIKSTRRNENNAEEIVQHLTYTHDPVGNVTRSWDYTFETVFNNNQKVDPLSGYDYDALYRLIKANGRQHQGITENTYKNNHADGDFMQSKFSPLPSLNDADKLENYLEIYTYDNSGNLIKKQHQASSASWTKITEVEKNSNRLLNHNYDDSGNMRTLEINNTVTLSYNCCENLVKAGIIERPDELDDCDYYLYDSQEQRTRKVSQRIAQGGTVSYIEEKTYLGNYELKRNYSGSVEDPSKLNFERQTIRIMDGDTCVLMVETITRDKQNPEKENTTQYRFQLTDDLSSISLEMDKMAKLISYEEYFPYGGTAIIAGENKAEVSKKEYRYSGKERDDTTGFYYYGARYYLPWLGRWLNPDPAGTVDGMNLYAFVKGNPVSWADYKGNWIYAPAAIGALSTAYTSYEIASEKGYTGLKLAGLTLTGGILGGATGHIGSKIASSTVSIAQTASIAFTSTVTSGALSYASSGGVDTVTSLGGITFNWKDKSVNYPFKSGNSTIDNISLLAGLSANVTDVFSLFGRGTNVQLVTEFDLKATMRGEIDLIGHSAIVNTAENINISVGPVRPFFNKGASLRQQFSDLFTSKGGRDWPSYYGTTAGWTVPIHNVNKGILSGISTNILKGKDALGSSLLYSGICNSCVGHTSDALMRVGVAPFLSLGLHPFLLHGIMAGRHLGILNNPFQAIKPKQQEHEHAD